MLPKRIDGATRAFGAPPDWQTNAGHCSGLSVRDTPTDQGNFMVSAWEPTPAELAALNAGASVRLWVRGTIHPVVAIYVGDETSAG